MGVPAGKYVKTAKATSAVACDSGYTTLAHNVLYGSTSSCSARSISCAAEKYLKKSTTDCSNCPRIIIVEEEHLHLVKLQIKV